MTLEIRKDLCADGLFKIVKEYLGKIEDHREGEVTITLADSLMSGFAMFSLKDPSLLQFDNRRIAEDQNLHNIYLIEQAPSDTRMREINDGVDPFSLSKVFRAIFRVAQRGKVLEKMEFYEGYYLVAGDGTGYFSSNTIHCENCLIKTSSKNGVTYYHQMYCMAIVKPGEKGVIPLTPEPIIKQDGNSKNDCERNASKRAIERLRREHPHLRIILTEDGLASNAPHIRDLKEFNIRFLIIANEGDHKFLFRCVGEKEELGKVSFVRKEIEGIKKVFRFINGVPLNSSNMDLLVNFLEYWEIDKKGKILHFAWVTDITLKEENLETMVAGGRAKWKIENETFNTLKNQGYHFEHNYGHGSKNLSVVFAFLMMLAFLVDQIQQLACGLFNAVWSVKKTKLALWEDVRSYFRLVTFPNMYSLYTAIMENLQFKYNTS
ncbi:MAG: transposase [Leptospiraceae bacterium]|nr:transposase [Leptospiraceae bacterium]